MSGFRIGHWTDTENQTGCTVVLFDRLTAAVCDVRGGAPATRETDLLAPERLVGHVDAILLTGGSAFGLAAADGVMQYLGENGRGWPTAVLPVPIVPTAAIYDLGVGNPVWPTADAGRAACESAAPPASVKTGRIGAGTGSTYRKMFPGIAPLPGGFGYSVRTIPEGPSIHAMVVVNALGDVVRDGAQLFDRSALVAGSIPGATEGESTTLGIVMVEGSISARGLRRLPIAAHDAYARKIIPCHTLFDGDIVFATALEVNVPEDPMQETRIAIAAELAMEEAIRKAIAP